MKKEEEEQEERQDGNWGWERSSMKERGEGALKLVVIVTEVLSQDLKEGHS